MCGENPGMVLGPSQEVDKGWHSFMLGSVPYHKLTYGLFGRYIHHVPELDSVGGRDCTNCSDIGGRRLDVEIGRGYFLVLGRHLLRQ
jgi:hypothetical protein